MLPRDFKNLLGAWIEIFDAMITQQNLFPNSLAKANG